MLRDGGHLLSHGETVGRDFADDLCRLSLQELAECGEELEEFDGDEFRRSDLFDELFGAGGAPEDVAVDELTLGQQPGSIFVALVFKEAPDEHLARVGQRSVAVVGLCGLRLGEQHLAFDLDERGRHDEVFACDTQIQLPHRVDVGEILLRDEGDGDVEDVDLMRLDEVEQKIEGTFELTDLKVQRLATEEHAGRVVRFTQPVESSQHPQFRTCHTPAFRQRLS